MLVCAVCRSQNMDSAKFCGNCGNAFSRNSEPASSLIDCPQGHIYSAAYPNCPYCPQADAGGASAFNRRPSAPSGFDESFGSIDQLSAASLNGPKRSDSRFDSLEPPPRNSSRGTRSVSAQAFQHSAPTEMIKSASNADPFGDMSQGIDSSKSAAAAALLTSDGDRRSVTMDEQNAPARASKGKIVGWLITYNRNPDGEDFRIYAGYNRIGANPVCDIMVDDETVSGSHAIIVYRDGRCLIKDDLSRNGTFVNGREITEAYPLQNYDQIRLGNTYLTYISARRT
ncbi:MAG: FHA domain-containing protein [Blastocatellia bacterium]|nr:FHA domain-containing protein [Blastocatellia bacterium]